MDACARGPDEPPLLKLAVLGDRIWLKHYHPGLSADTLPEYVIENRQGSGELYPIFYEYFMSRWDDASVPGVDLDAEDLVLREATRREVRTGVGAQEA